MINEATTRNNDNYVKQSCSFSLYDFFIPFYPGALVDNNISHPVQKDVIPRAAKSVFIKSMGSTTDSKTFSKYWIFLWKSMTSIFIQKYFGWNGLLCSVAFYNISKIHPQIEQIHIERDKKYPNSFIQTPIAILLTFTGFIHGFSLGILSLVQDIYNGFINYSIGKLTMNTLYLICHKIDSLLVTGLNHIKGMLIRKGFEMLIRIGLNHNVSLESIFNSYIYGENTPTNSLGVFDNSNVKKREAMEKQSMHTQQKEIEKIMKSNLSRQYNNIEDYMILQQPHKSQTIDMQYSFSTDDLGETNMSNTNKIHTINTKSNKSYQLGRRAANK